MSLTFHDRPVRESLLPLTFARPVSGLRCGILTLAEKWPYYLGGMADDLLISGDLLAERKIASEITDLEAGTALYEGDRLVAARLPDDVAGEDVERRLATCQKIERHRLNVRRLSRPADIFLFNDEELRKDFALLTANRTSAPLPDTNTLIGPVDQLFLEEGVGIEGCTINTKTGPVYFGRNVQILEGCLLRGPIAILEGGVLKMGTRMYGATTIGPRCKVGGEISNVVFQANSNKGHDGYLGNAVIGEWCNIGADTNASNLKNDYGDVKVWSYAAGGRRATGLQFHGLIMGDHSKCGINTMFNTGTVVGFSANIFGPGFPPPFLPSFSWGGAEGLITYRLDKALATAKRVMARRGHSLTEVDRQQFAAIFAATERYRKR
jgi:UDP-N-acetylglucosamine diphosphorylase/glucosamine-1-phosphate N-acetyltransferase